MRTIKSEKSDKHENLKSLSKKSVGIDSKEDDVETLMSELEILEE